MTNNYDFPIEFKLFISKDREPIIKKSQGSRKLLESHFDGGANIISLKNIISKEYNINQNLLEEIFIEIDDGKEIICSEFNLDLNLPLNKDNTLKIIIKNLKNKFFSNDNIGSMELNKMIIEEKEYERTIWWYILFPIRFIIYILLFILLLIIWIILLMCAIPYNCLALSPCKCLCPCLYPCLCKEINDKCGKSTWNLFCKKPLSILNNILFWRN